ncbi:MAG: hypothetical protein R3A78_07570 [Polyangiales bacterium]|nr:hypothetical protein [Myxococcales bacterium]
MRPTHAILLALGIAAGLLFTADAVMVSDEEAFEDLAAAFETSRDPAEVVLGYVDVSRSPLEIAADGSAVRIDEDREGELDQRIGDAVRPFQERGARVVQRHVEVKGDRAEIALRAATPDGDANAFLTFRRKNGSWYLTRLRVPAVS